MSAPLQAFVLLSSFTFIASSSVLQDYAFNTPSSNLDWSIDESDITTLSTPPWLDLSSPTTRPPLTLTNLPIADTRTDTSTGPATNLTGGHSLGTALAKCDGDTYGHGLNIASCQEAWELLPDTDGISTFGKRETGKKFDIMLPYRSLSSDGLCAIDIVIKEGVTEDKASTGEITSAAFILLEGCVKSDKNSGGVSARLGNKQALGVRIVLNNPRNKVRCTTEPDKRAPPADSCRPILDGMPATYKHQMFGKEGVPAVDVGLPKGFLLDTERCVICANHVKGPPTEANWYIVYLAAIAIDAMCVRRGLAGIAWDIGISGHGGVFVTIRDENPPNDGTATS